MRLAIPALLAVIGCSTPVVALIHSGGEPADAGTDAGRPDGGVDAGADAGSDAGMGAGTDAGRDAGTGAGIDSGVPDAGPPNGSDGGDAGALDGGPTDAGPVDAGEVILSFSFTQYTWNNYTSLASGDLNGDGILDLVAVRFCPWPCQVPGGFDVLLGQPDGGLGPPIFISGVADGKATPIIADLNGDGLADIAVSQGATVSVFLQMSDGGLASAATYDASSAVYELGVGDLNGDGRPDLVLAEQTSDELLLNEGSGVFSLASPLPGCVLGTSSSAFGDDVVWGDLAVADFNADNLPDLAVASQDGGALLILLNQGDGGFAATVYDVEPVGRIAVMPAAPGAPNLALQTDARTVQVLVNSGSGTFELGAVLPMDFDVDYLIWLSAGDFDGDGLTDLAISGLTGDCDYAEMHIAYGKADGGFLLDRLGFSEFSPTGLAPLGSAIHLQALAVGDSCGGGVRVISNASGH